MMPSPGEIMQREMVHRGFSRWYLARVMKIPVRTVRGLMAGATRVTPEIAAKLGVAFGTSSALWEGLERSYREHTTTAD